MSHIHCMFHVKKLRKDFVSEYSQTGVKLVLVANFITWHETGNIEEREPRPSTRTRDLGSNAEFQPRKPQGRTSCPLQTTRFPQTKGAFRNHGVDHGHGGKMLEDDNEPSASKLFTGLACKSLHLLFFGFPKWNSTGLLSDLELIKWYQTKQLPLWIMYNWLRTFALAVLTASVLKCGHVDKVCCL